MISRIVANYDPCGETEINADQWKKIYTEAEQIGGDLFEAVREITPWVEDNFVWNEVFTILGV